MLTEIPNNGELDVKRSFTVLLFAYHLGGSSMLDYRSPGRGTHIWIWPDRQLFTEYVPWSVYILISVGMWNHWKMPSIIKRRQGPVDVQTYDFTLDLAGYIYDLHGIHIVRMFILLGFEKYCIKVYFASFKVNRYSLWNIIHVGVEILISKRVFIANSCPWANCR